MRVRSHSFMNILSNTKVPNQKTRTSRKHNTKGTHQIKLRHTWFRIILVLISGLICYLTYIYGVKPFKLRWRALYGTEEYPSEYSIRGIDISHHQGNIDWKKLANSRIKKDPISFIFIKATEGQDFIDKNFNDNFYQAREYGFLRSAYHYFKPNVPGKEQAKFYLKQVHLEVGDLPPILDIEEKGDLSTEQLQKEALDWLRIVEKQYNVPPILYTNYKFKLKYLNTSDFRRYPYWIAHYYVKSVKYQGEWKFWQHTDQGEIEGIKGKVDLNIYNSSMYELKRLCIEDPDQESDRL